MSTPFAAIAGVIALASSFAISYTSFDLSESSRPPGINVSDVEIWDDGSTFYDRDTVDGKWLSWSGSILQPDGETLVCRGGGHSQYFNDLNPLGSEDVGWLVSPDCVGKIKAGMLFVFTWTPINSDFGDVRFPAQGYGVIRDAATKGDKNG